MNIVQIGCNDCNDEVYNFIVENSDQINNFFAIDALPNAAITAKNKYNFLEKKLNVINCAVGLSNGLISFYYPQDSDMSEHASLSIDHLQCHGYHFLTKIIVPIIEINTLLSSITKEIGKINKFYIDTEGFDVPILLQMDLNKYTPDYLEFEYIHSDGPKTIGPNLNNLLAKLQNKYNSIELSGHYNVIAQSLK